MAASSLSLIARIAQFRHRAFSKVAAMLCVMSLAACSSGRQSSKVYPITYDSTVAKYEVMLSQKRHSLGGPCTINLIPSSYEEVHYLYLPSRTGHFEASDLVITSTKDDLAHPRFSKLRGDVTVMPDSLRINLEYAEFGADDRITGYVKWDFNGTARLTEVAENLK